MNRLKPNQKKLPKKLWNESQIETDADHITTAQKDIATFILFLFYRDNNKSPHDNRAGQYHDG